MPGQVPVSHSSLAANLQTHWHPIAAYLHEVLHELLVVTDSVHVAIAHHSVEEPWQVQLPAVTAHREAC